MTSTEQKKHILVTGGAGYIGSHITVEILDAGYDVIVIDNCSNVVKGDYGIPESVNRINKITGKEVIFHEVDLVNIEDIRQVFSKYSIQTVFHTAGLKSETESIKRPLDYYRVNFAASLNLLEVMKENAVKNLIFSSSVYVYGDSCEIPFVETLSAGVNMTSPYARTKFFIEEMLKDVYTHDKNWNIILLRYFNSVGAHESGLLGECPPQGKATNLMPAVVEAALGKRPHIKVFGNDFDTPDGTGVRDYLHVVDIAKAHVAALRTISDNCGPKIYNLGTGKGCSVLEMIAALEKASGKKIPYVVSERRPGEIGTIFANPSLALKELGWKAERSLDKSCEDLWRFHTMNPNGYD